MTAAREDAFAEVSHVLTEYADEIGALLRPADGEEPRVISIQPPPESVATTAGDAAAVRRRLPDAVAQQRAITQVVAQFPPDLQALARTLLFGRSSHAVQRHGHHLTPDRMIARLQWLLDPAGVDGWRLNEDGTAESWRPQVDGSHQPGASSGCHTSAEAVAKPLIALLRAAGATRTALDAFLDSKAGGATIIKEYDMVNHGKRPGSLIVFARQPAESWRLITSYFADDPHRVEYMEL